MIKSELNLQQQSDIVTPEIQQILPVMNLIIEEMSQAFNEGLSYKVLIADGKESRIPALILKYYLEYLTHSGPISTIFVEGERIEFRPGQFELYSRSRIQLENKIFKKRDSLSLSPTKKTLIVTSRIDTGNRINLLAQELQQNSVPFDIASLTRTHDIDYYYDESKLPKDVHIYPQSAMIFSTPDLSKFAGFTRVHHNFNTTLTKPRKSVVESRRDIRKVVTNIIFNQSQQNSSAS